MRSTWLRRWLSALMAFMVLFSGAALPALQAAELTATHEEQERGFVEFRHKMAEKIYSATSKVVERAVERANRSERVNLELKLHFLDDAHRMFFDIQGVARVKVPGKRWRKKIQEVMEEGTSYVMASNGTVATDVVATPLTIDGDEVQFALQLDLTVQLDELFQKLVRAGASVAGGLAARAMLSQLYDALQVVDGSLIGDGVATGIRRLASLLSGDAAEYEYRKELHETGLGKFIPDAIDGDTLRRHFVVALITAASAGGVKIVATTLGTAVASVFFPAGGGVVVAFLTTRATYWFGTWIAHRITTRLPVMWKLKKIARLGRKVAKAEGEKKIRLEKKLEEYSQAVAKRLEQEMNGSMNRWVFFGMMTKYLKNHREEAEEDGDESFDVEVFRPLIEQAKEVLRYRALQEHDWYAARMYYQLLGAIGELPDTSVPKPEGEAQ